MKNRTFIAFALLFSCAIQSQDITGLWLVDRVAIGDQEMTPNGKWVETQQGGAQSTGNGWKQHTLGKWRLQEGELSLVSTNMPADPFGPFELTWAGDTMLWSRDEEGMWLTVHLVRIEQLPTTDADRLLGIWTQISNEGAVGSIFFRWDNVYEKHHPDGEIERGTYRIHGHRNNVELVPYGDKPVRSFWDFEINQNQLIITTGEGEESVGYTYLRGR